MASSAIPADPKSIQSGSDVGIRICAPDPRSRAAVDSFLNSFDDDDVVVTAPAKVGAIALKAETRKKALVQHKSARINEWKTK